MTPELAVILEPSGMNIEEISAQVHLDDGSDGSERRAVEFGRGFVRSRKSHRRIATSSQNALPSRMMGKLATLVPAIFLAMPARLAR